MPAEPLTRRALLQRGLAWGLAGAAWAILGGFWPWRWPGAAVAETPSSAAVIPTRPLGTTGVGVTLLGLGGEGVLRTTGRMREAVPVIRRAVERGINYFDTAPAYQQSQDYLGEALGGDRPRLFLASKTHDRTRDGSLRLLEDSLRRLRTNHLDLWQLHDLRTTSDLERVFAPGGALEAAEQAKRQRLIRFIGITGHYDPAILVEALRRHPFDTVLCSLNVADRAHQSFQDTVVPAAQSRGAGVIAMKVMAAGQLPSASVTVSHAIRYALTLPVSTAIIGCRSPAEVDENVQVATTFLPLDPATMARLEAVATPMAPALSGFKQW